VQFLLCKLFKQALQFPQVQSLHPPSTGWFICCGPKVLSHESAVQLLLSFIFIAGLLQLGPVPESLHEPAVWQASEAEQTTGEEPTQLPLLQLKLVLEQLKKPSQLLPLGLLVSTHPVLVLQL
jgi:hypothetical protein